MPGPALIGDRGRGSISSLSSGLLFIRQHDGQHANGLRRGARIFGTVLHVGRINGQKTCLPWCVMLPKSCSPFGSLSSVNTSKVCTFSPHAFIDLKDRRRVKLTEADVREIRALRAGRGRAEAHREAVRGEHVRDTLGGNGEDVGSVSQGPGKPASG